MKTALPISLSLGKNPQNLLSCEFPLLSPIMKYSPSGTVNGPQYIPGMQGKITQELSECTIEKSKSLTDNYLDRAIKALNKLESNQFRDVLIDFTKQLKEKK